MALSRTKLLVAAAVTTVGISAVAIPASTASTHSSRAEVSAAATQGTLVSHVVGSFTGGTVTGHYVPLRTIVVNGRTYMQGNLTAKLVKTDGTVVGQVTRHDATLRVNAPGAHMQSAAAASCTILHLVLGPLDLNLLGLMVHLDRVVLDITAVSGSGNLLGNLLCAIAHLLDNTSPTLTQLLTLSNLLNRIITILT